MEILSIWFVENNYFVLLLLVIVSCSYVIVSIIYNIIISKKFDIFFIFDEFQYIAIYLKLALTPTL